MRRFIVLAAVVLASCAGPAAIRGQTCATTITMSPSGADELTAHYALCAATTEYALESYNTPQRTNDWSAADTGFVFDGTNVRRDDGAAFEEFTLRLRADTTFHDRRYIAADRVGSGWSLMLQALAPAEGQATLRFAGFAPSDVVFAEGRLRRAGAVRLQLNQESENLIYAGPRAFVYAGPVTIIAGDEIPPWLRERFIRETTHASNRMTARLGRSLEAPTLIVTHAMEGRGRGTKGGALSGNVVELRIRDVELREDDTMLAESLTNTVTHEAVHLWIGHLWKAARNNEEPWLHEGGAEYLASRLWQSPESLREESAQHLNGCLLRTNGAPLDGSAGPVYGAVPYDCGFSIMLAAEAASMRAGRGDIFDLWRAVVESAGPEGFTPAGFLAEARARGGEEFSRVASLLMSATTNPQLSTIAEPLAAIGITIAPRAPGAPESGVLLSRSLMPVMAELCRAGGRSYGYSTAPDRIILDTEQTCGAALAGNPEVVSVNGADLIQTPAAAYEAIRTACTSRSALQFTTLDGRVLPPVTCTASIAPMPTIYAVTALPTLPQP